VKKLEGEKHILGQRVAQLEAELENARKEIEKLKEKLEAACQLVLSFSFKI
jgi:predicted  nucleic acid-binding Zn-ribbon protein